MCLKSNTFQLDSSSTMNIWSLVVDINFTLGLVCPITFASLQARVRLYTGVSVHGGKLTRTSYGGGGGGPGPFGPPSVSAPASHHLQLCCFLRNATVAICRPDPFCTILLTDEMRAIPTLRSLSKRRERPQTIV